MENHSYLIHPRTRDVGCKVLGQDLAAALEFYRQQAQSRLLNGQSATADLTVYDGNSIEEIQSAESHKAATPADASAVLPGSVVLRQLLDASGAHRQYVVWAGCSRMLPATDAV